jgi:hypothetical protein
MLAQINLSQLNASQTMTLLIVTISIVAGAVIVVSATLAGAWQKVHNTRVKCGLTQQMIERGMSSEEIAQVLASQRRKGVAGAVQLPCASEAVVESDGEWRPALVLQAAEGRYYVHFVGTDMDDNEWVPEDRIRFPTGSHVPNLVATLTPTFGGRDGVPAKPPMEAEL